MDDKIKLYLDQLRKDAESVGGYVLPISQKTPSMLGNPYAGNTVVVLPQPEYKPDDDIVFKAGPDKNTLHRVTHVKPGYVYTKGTFNANGDGWIPIADVLGKVSQVVRTKEKGLFTP